MLIFLAVITAFPVIAALLLRGKYFKLVLILALVNMAIAGIAYQTIIVPSSHCKDAAMAAGTSTNACNGHILLFEIVSVFNILFAVVIWYLAFKRGPAPVEAPYDTTKGPLVGSQLAAQKPSNREGIRKILTASGWLIVLSIVGIIAFFVYAFSAI